MKRFVDLHLRIPLEDRSETEKMISRASELGYRLLATPLPLQVTKERIIQLKQICKDADVDLVTRVNFTPQNPNELLHNLRRYRRKFEVVAVRCHTKNIARQAAKDRRVDILQFSVTNLHKRFFDQAEAELASQAVSSLEIELAPLLQFTSFSRIHLLSNLRKEVAIAERFKVPIILTSGATEEKLMRVPQNYAALTTLFDLPLSSALRALSENPWNIVNRNRKKLSPDYVAPGIKVLGMRTDD
jgi:ribonuclease P/MRP protein subunit RPP1